MARLDADIKQDVIDHLYWDDRVDAQNIEVTVDVGQVTLSGSVPTSAGRRAAEDDAWDVPGVNAVTNDLTIAYPVDVDVPSGEEVQGDVARVLSLNSDVAHEDIRVKRGEEGQVTLEGNVDAYWKKYRAEALASDVTGVTGVYNMIAVVPSERVNDQEIADGVMGALKHSQRVDASLIDVQVNEGNVVLSGDVPSWTAAQAAYEAALHTAGVTDIENKLTVELPA